MVTTVTRYMLGNEAIAHACCEANLDFASGYPGTPSSEVIDTLRAQKLRDFYVEWSVNEKVAFENALGAAWTGVRSLFTTKHVADSLQRTIKVVSDQIHGDVTGEN